MPKQLYIPRPLPREQPDRCELCPLVGIIPDEDRRKGLRERYYCLGIFEALKDAEGHPIMDAETGEQKLSFPRLKTKGIKTSAKAVKSGGHRLHRPCDLLWPAWMTLPGRLFGMPADTYTKYRLPYEHEQQVKQQPKFKFRKI